LARRILAVAREFDAEAEVTLSVSLDFCRVIPDSGIAVGDLQLAAGLSKEAIATRVGRFEKAGLASLGDEPGAKKWFTLTADGITVRDRAMAAVGRLADDATVRAPLEEIVVDRLADGLVPPERGWRATGPYRAQTKALSADPAAALPWFPMASHRGGYPDGS
jgi:hypothetical protein